MKIIQQSEIDGASQNYLIKFPSNNIIIRQRTINNFKAGVEFAESKLKDLTIEFLTWYETSDIQNIKSESGLPIMGKNFDINKYNSELFEIFIKERL